MSSSGNLRQQMPTVAGWIDELRATFGKEGIDAQIRGGMNGQPTFWARENGIEIGARIDESQYRVLRGADMVHPLKPADQEARKGK